MNPGAGVEHPGVRPRRFRDDGGDAARVGGEGCAHGIEVVVRQHESLRGDGGRHTCRSRKREGREPRSRLGEQSVGVAVVVTGELDHEVATGRGAGQADRGHRRLGAGRDEAQFLDHRQPVDDEPGDDGLGEFGLAGCARPERQAAGGGLLHGGDDLGMRVPEQRRTPRRDEVDELACLRRR